MTQATTRAAAAATTRTRTATTRAAATLVALKQLCCQYFLDQPSPHELCCVVPSTFKVSTAELQAPNHRPCCNIDCQPFGDPATVSVELSPRTVLRTLWGPLNHNQPCTVPHLLRTHLCHQQPLPTLYCSANFSGTRQPAISRHCIANLLGVPAATGQTKQTKTRLQLRMIQVGHMCWMVFRRACGPLCHQNSSGEFTLLCCFCRASPVTPSPSQWGQLALAVRCQSGR